MSFLVGRFLMSHTLVGKSDVGTIFIEYYMCPINENANLGQSISLISQKK